MNRTARTLLIVTGVLLIAGGLAHAVLGWPAVRQELAAAQASTELKNDVAVGWLYGSGAMLTFGVIVLAQCVPSQGVRAPAVLVAGPIAAFYLIFGTSAWLGTSMSPHFIGFIVKGLLSAGAVLALRRGRPMIPRGSAAISVIAAGLLAVAAYAAPLPAPIPSVSLPAALARVLTDYETAWRNKDAAALAGLFALDGFVLSNGAPPVRGREAIRKHYEGQGGPLSLRAMAFATGGSVGYIIGGFARHEGETDIGKFTLTLRRGEGGRWLIVSDMDNGNSLP